MENFESNLFMKIGNFFFNIGLHYKTGGIKAIYNYYSIGIKIKMFKWRYKHSEKFRNKVIKNSNLSGLFGKAVIEQIFFNKPIDYKSIYNSFTEEEKANFKVNIERAIKDTIERYNITDEKEIKNLKKMFDFEQIK